MINKKKWYSEWWVKLLIGIIIIFIIYKLISPIISEFNVNKELQDIIIEKDKQIRTKDSIIQNSKDKIVEIRRIREKINVNLTEDELEKLFIQFNSYKKNNNPIIDTTISIDKLFYYIDENLKK
ncbi:MAG TPA: hypothetical protein PKD16_01465 [Saprospiraceae bacterium]|jgi:hypothetical protein|nr:hypothetical protein [Saprospiraceae bacterium]